MFEALKHAFRGQAGLPATILSYALVALIILAMIFGIPKIERTVTANTQQALQSTGYPQALIDSTEARGRDVKLSGFTGDELSHEHLEGVVESAKGVRWLCLDDKDSGSSDVTANKGNEKDNKAETSEASKAEKLGTTVAAVTAAGVAATAALKGQADETLAEEGAVTEKGAEVEAINADVEQATQEARQETNQPALAQTDTKDNANLATTNLNADAAANPAATASGLTAHYKAGQLLVTGYLPDQESVSSMSNAITGMRRGGLTSLDIQSGGQPSDLAWRSDFLGAVASIPGDAVGKITANDETGVQIIPEGAETHVTSGAAQAGIEQEDTEAGVTASVQEQAASEALAGAEDNTQRSAYMGSNAIQATQQADSGVRMGMSMGGGNTNNTGVSVGNTASNGAQIETGSNAAQAPADMRTQQMAAVDRDGLSQAGGASSSMLDYIVQLNHRLAGNNLFTSGRMRFSPQLGDELNQLAEQMKQYPNALLRVVGNIDFNLDPRDGERVGVMRARAVRDYLRQQGIEAFRIFAAPLPRGYAYDPQTQIVFYISE